MIITTHWQTLVVEPVQCPGRQCDHYNTLTNIGCRVSTVSWKTTWSLQHTHKHWLHSQYSVLEDNVIITTHSQTLVVEPVQCPGRQCDHYNTLTNIGCRASTVSWKTTWSLQHTDKHWLQSQYSVREDNVIITTHWQTLVAEPVQCPGRQRDHYNPLTNIGCRASPMSWKTMWSLQHTDKHWLQSQSNVLEDNVIITTHWQTLVAEPVQCPGRQCDHYNTLTNIGCRGSPMSWKTMWSLNHIYKHCLLSQFVVIDENMVISHCPMTCAACTGSWDILW